MANTRDIRRRIKSVKNTAQITKAMQMVAASKMRRAQELALAGRPFAAQFNKILTHVVKNIRDLSHPFLDAREDSKPCVLLITTDKGLCGGLNTNVLREVGLLPKDTQFVTIGRKGRQFLARTGRNLLADFEISEKVNFFEARQLANFLSEKFIKGEITSVTVLYSRFVNTLVQTPRHLTLLPMQRLTHLEIHTGGTNTPAEPEDAPDVEYQFEPSAESVLESLLPRYIQFMIYQTILSARASEHSARMVAMKSATDNAKQMVKDLTLEFNKARQAAITNEILEISSAQLAMG